MPTVFDTEFAAVQNSDLRAYLKRNINHPTVILCFIVLLQRTIELGVGTTMSKSDIERGFNAKIKEFGINTFRRDYLKRQSGDIRNAIDENDEQCFFIRSSFIDGITNEQLKEIIDDLNNFYGEKNQAISRFMSKISSAIETHDDEQSQQFIFDILDEDDSDSSQRRGQNFEICSFSILKMYFASFGFELNRFSTTYANDGGMDYIGQRSVYQVTVVMSQKKFDEDIVKTPGIKRIIVYKNIASGFDMSKFNHDLILRTISAANLKDYVIDLKNLRKAGAVTHILKTMLNEFTREFYLS